MVFKLKFVKIVGCRININDLRVRYRNIDIEKADGEAYDENRKGNMVK